MGAKKWTPEEAQFIRDHWETMTDVEMGEKLGRTQGAVAVKRRQMRVSTHRIWTAEEEEYLADKWGTVSIPGIAKRLNRSVNAVKVRAARLSLGPALMGGEYISLNQLITESQMAQYLESADGADPEP